MGKHKFVIVSNRLPVSVAKQDGKLVFTPSTGGLATAMQSLDTGGDRAWIGWPGIANEELTKSDRAEITEKLKEYGCYPVFLSRMQVQNFYEGYANDTIWPLFHYFQSFAQYDDVYWDAYNEVNAVFMEATADIADAQASIWIHDYHLMLLPRMLREKLPHVSIGFFLHIPFPSQEIFRLLPNRREVLEGLLGADLIGFHVYDYARHFLSSALRILGLESSRGSILVNGRMVKIDAFPIGIDYDKFVAALDDKATKREMQLLEKHYAGQKIILSVDRLDYSKGIMKRLEAYERMLKTGPGYIRKVALVIVAVPSRTEVETYKELRDDIEKAVGRINGTYGTVDWTPISYHFRNLPFHQVVALYAKADVAMVTPLRDGMNLVAKEYVASKQQTPGVLILSEMTGAIEELPEAIRINPNDISALTEAMRSALAIPPNEQIEKLQVMQHRLSQYTVQRWAADFIEQLKLTKFEQSARGSKQLDTHGEQRIAHDFKVNKQRLILLDYDGTLRGFVSSHSPQLAAPSPQLLDLMRGLSNKSGTRVCIVSGRPREVLENWFGELPVSLAAEHGAWMKYDGEWSQQQVSLHEHKKELLKLLRHYAERTPGAQVEEKDFALVWHYRNVPTELAFARSASLRYELGQLLRGTEVGVYAGQKIIEIKPRSVHKGAVAEDLAAMFPAGFVLCIGDDYTDEDMFAALPDEAYTIKVGLTDTRARFQLPSVERVLKLLDTLTD